VSRAQLMRTQAALRRNPPTAGRETSRVLRTVIWSAVGSLIVAGIGAGSALLGAQISSDAAAETTRQQLLEARAKDAREKRSQVYAAYLAAANDYSVKTHRMFERFKEQAVAAKGKSFKPDPAVLNPYYAARSAYQHQVNQVYVYGSDEAWKAHRIVAAALPPSLGDLELEVVDSDEFLVAYQGFQSVFCKEASAVPRVGCDDH
jgi:hypothetical protein